MNNKDLDTIRANRATLHLCRTVLDMDEMVCKTCHEPWEITREGVAQLDGAALLAIEFSSGFTPHMIKCPTCNRRVINTKRANALADSLPELPQDDEDPIDVISDLL